MFRALLIAASLLGGTALSSAATPPPGEPFALPHRPACGSAIRHVSLMAEAQMCPRPLATTIIAPPHHRLLHT